MTSGVFSTLPEDIRSTLPSSEDVLTRFFPPLKGKKIKKMSKVNRKISSSHLKKINKEN